MKSVTAVLSAAILATTLAVTASVGTARAETTPNSTISQVKVVEASNAKHRLFHGAIWLELDKATQNYRWGGAHCGSKTLSDINVSLLFAAFRSRHSVMIEYDVNRYKKHAYRCITGFTVARQ